MQLTATHLISLPRTTITHLVSGSRAPLGHGTLQLHLLTFPVTPHPNASSPPNYAAVTSTLDEKSTPASTEQGQCLLLSLESEAVHADEALAPSAAKFELPLAQTTQVIESPGGGYFIPFDGGFNPHAGGGSHSSSTAVDEDGAGFVEVVLSADASADSRDSFEEILATLTKFQPKQYVPSVPTEPADEELRNQLVLVDADGSVVGKLESDLAEDGSIATAPTDEASAVVISSDASGKLTASKWVPADNPTNSSIVNFANYVSGGVVYGSEWASEHLTRAGDRATSVPRDASGKELTFSPIAKKGASAGYKVTSTALSISGKTVGVIANAAAGVGDRLGRTLGIQSTPGGKPPTGIRGLVNRSLVAANTIVDSLEYGGKTLLTAGSDSANQVITHRYGQEAGALSASVGNSAKHVALIYVDVRGIQRRALLKTVGKSALRAKMKDGSVVELEPESAEGVEAIAQGASGEAKGGPPALPARTEKGTGTATLLPASGEKGQKSAPALPPRERSASPRTTPPPVPARPFTDSKTGL